MSRDTEEVTVWSGLTLVLKTLAFFKILCCHPAQALPLLYSPLRNVIGGLSFSQLIGVLKDLSLTSNESLTLACQNKVCSPTLMSYTDGNMWNVSDSSSSNLPVWTLLTLCSPVTRREAPVLWSSSGAQHRWLWDLVCSSLKPPFCFSTWWYSSRCFRTDSIFQVAGQLSQCSLVEPLLLPSNLLTLFCRYLDKRTVHQLKNNMEWVSCQLYGSWIGLFIQIRLLIILI